MHQLITPSAGPNVRNHQADRAVDVLNGLLSEPAYRRNQLWRLAEGAEASVKTALADNCLGERQRSLRELTGPKLEQLLDPRRPTLGVIGGADGLGSAALMAVGAARPAVLGKRSVNVLFLPEASIDAFETGVERTGRQVLGTRYGVMMDSEGKAFFVQFNTPAKIDLLAGASRCKFPKVGDLSAAGTLQLNSAEVEQLTADKLHTKLFLRYLGLPTPSYFLCSRERSGEVREQILRLVRESSARHLVVKPLDGSGGRGVHIFNAGDERRYLDAIFDALQIRDSLLCEQRVESLPYFDRRGQRLDWNVRLLATYEGPVDMEARLGPWGEPVNKCRGASVHEVDGVFTHLGVSRESCDKAKDELCRMGTRIAQALHASLLGIDAIWDGDRWWIIEVNGERSGGFTSLAEIRASEQDKFRCVRRFSAFLASRVRHSTADKGTRWNGTLVRAGRLGEDKEALDLLEGLPWDGVRSESQVRRNNVYDFLEHHLPHLPAALHGPLTVAALHACFCERCGDLGPLSRRLAGVPQLFPHVEGYFELARRVGDRVRT